MSIFNGNHGNREAPGGVRVWWERYRLWLAGLSRDGRIRWRVCQVLAAVAILAAGVTLGLSIWIRLPTVPEPPEQPGVHTDGNGSQSQPDVEYTGAELPNVTRSGRKDGYYTFLLAGRDVVSGATDTMILITYDTKDKKVNAISLLRDTMVNTAGKSGGQKRLNAVFARNMGERNLSDRERINNGMTALKREVSRLTGIYPDFYVMVEWEAIGNLVEAVGGVEFEVPFDMDYDDPYQNLHIHQKKGLRLLNGQDAMEVVRFRKNNNESIRLGDVGRTQIQRDFLAAVLKKCLTPEILLRLPALVQIFTDNVDTDLSVGNILAFAQLSVGMNVDADVKFAPMPCTLVSYRGASLALVNQNELLELVNDGLNPYLDEIGADDLQLMYRKSGGGFGVTNGTLLDPAVGRGSSGFSTHSGSSSGKNQQNESPDNDTTNTTPEENPDSPGGDDDPGGITDINPGDIFPEPPPDTGDPGPEEQDTPVS